MSRPKSPSDLVSLRTTRCCIWTLLFLFTASVLTFAQDGVDPVDPADPDPAEPRGGSISGKIFDDVNGNGQVDVGEAMLCSVLVEAHSPLDTRTTVTDERGHFQFDGLELDETYYVQVGQDTEGVPISPPTGGHSVHLVEGRKFTALDFAIAVKCPRQHREQKTHKAGANDNFALGNNEPASPGSAMQQARPGCEGRWSDFDNPKCDTCFGHTFTNIKPRDCYVLGARLTIRMRANHGCFGLSHNDTLSLGSNGNTSWGKNIGSLVGSPWTAGSDQTITLNLAALPGPGSTTVNMISALQSGSLDVFVQDDTAVDYMELTVTYCCRPEFSGHKFEDANGNGVWDSGEQPVAGWVINIVPPNNLGVSVLTDANGYWSYQATLAGTYNIWEGSQAGWVQTAPSTGSYNLNWVPGQIHSKVTFGNMKVCDDPKTFVAQGGEEDGFDPTNDEPTSPNDDLVDLLSDCSAGAQTSFDTPDVCNRCFGHTLSVPLDPSCRVVGGRLTIRVRGHGCLSGNDGIGFIEGSGAVWYQSLANLSTSSTWGVGSDETFVLDLANLPASGAGVTNVLSHVQDGSLSVYIQDDSSVDFARLELDVCCPCLPGTICGVKFNDLDGDGVQDSDEPGLPGWEIDLVGPTQAYRVVTDAEGRYCIEVEPGVYTVAEIQQAGWVQTYPTTVTHTIDVCGSLESENVYIADFGNVERCEEPIHSACLVGLEDEFDTTNEEPNAQPSPALLAVMQNCSNGPRLAFDDLTSNRCFGHTFKRCWEKGCVVVAARLIISLRAGQDPLCYNDTISFGDDGSFSWSGKIAALAGGSWNPGDSAVLTLDLANLPPSGTAGITNVLALLQDGDLDVFIQDDTGVDFMILETEVCCFTSITGQKFEDVNGNGIKDGSENGIPGWAIELRDSSGTVVATTSTDASGNYSFSGLAPANYVVNEVQSPGWTQTAPGSVTQPVSTYGNVSVGGVDFGNKKGCEGEMRQERCEVGEPDDFDTSTPEFLDPDPALLAHMQTISGGALTQLDVLPGDRAVGHTFRECWEDDCCVVKAQLCMRIRASQSSLAHNDTIQLFDGATPVWGARIASIVGAWGAHSDAEICLDLGNLPADKWGTTSVLASLQDGDLGVMIQDDTGIDWMTLELELCCPCVDDTGIVSTTWEAPCCNGKATIAVQIHNPTGTPQNYAWDINSLPAGYCDLPGPVGFSPSNGTMTVNPGDTGIAYVSVDCSNIHEEGASCFEVNAYNLETGCHVVSEMSTGDGYGSIGSVIHSNEIKAIPVDLVLQQEIGTPIRPGFMLENHTDKALVVDVVIEAMPPFGKNNISLDGLPPGEPVVRTVKLPPGSNDNNVEVEALVLDHEPFVFYDIILRIDNNGDGDPEPVASTAVELRSPEGDEGTDFIRGDANGDGGFDLGDSIFTLNHLFLGHQAPPCRVSADTNGDNTLDLGDAIAGLGYLFRGGAAPPAPFPDCGKDLEG